MNDYPADTAERRRIRDRKANEGAARGRVQALSLVMSNKCSGDQNRWPTRHAGSPDGCANNGSTCLCECHDQP